jgi:hypothetical protein
MDREYTPRLRGSSAEIRTMAGHHQRSIRTFGLGIAKFQGGPEPAFLTRWMRNSDVCKEEYALERSKTKQTFKVWTER